MKPVVLSWTLHAQMKMRFYRLSQERVRRVLHSPKRTEVGIAPKTTAMMQPAALKTTNGKPGSKETWTQEIWVMIQDAGKNRKVISAWRYPGITKPRGEDAAHFMRKEYKEFVAKGGE